VRSVEGISPRYLLSIKDISGDLFVDGDLASASEIGGAFKVTKFSTLPIQWT
jgi:hypothetical protein